MEVREKVLDAVELAVMESPSSPSTSSSERGAFRSRSSGGVCGVLGGGGLADARLWRLERRVR